MKKLTLLLITLLMVGTSIAQEYEPKWIELTDAERTLVQKNNDFAFRLFQKSRTEDSQILSPLSITYALGMLNNGAKGQTQQEICDVLGFGEAGTEGINQFCRKLLTEVSTLDKETQVSIANNIYVNQSRGFRLKSLFVEKAAEFYDATPESRDFNDGKTRDVINQWASDHTQGMIPEILKPDEFDPETISYLLNALYFKGAWVNKFDPKGTMLTYFDNQRKTAEMMMQEGEFLYAENDLYQSIVMPYGNGAYQMTVFLPLYGRNLDDVVNALNGKNWNKEGYKECHVSVMFPRFETGTDLRLEEIMSSLGMPNAFDGRIKMAKCKGCGQDIIWIGKMPCDPDPVTYWQKPKAKGKIVTPNGEVISCEFFGDPQSATGIGYVPHWATCPKAGEFRRRK